jgi:hypothetical protein
MNRILLSLLCLALVIGFTKISYAQSTTTMQDIFTTVEKKITELEDTQNQEIVNITFDLIVGQGKKVVLRNLDPSFAYNVTVIGDRRVTKSKISVRKKGAVDWDYVDELSDAKPMLRIEPAEFAQYEFTVSVDEFTTGNTAGHFALLIYHKNPERER